MKVKGKTISKAKLSDLVELSPETIAKMTKAETLAVTKRLHAAAERRLKVIEKHGLTSYAENAYFQGSLPVLATKEASRQKIQHQMVQLQSFLGAKTSTYTGLKKVLKAEEERIFEGGRGFTSDAQRERFWSAYMEFKRQSPTMFAALGSTRIQQFIGQETFWRRRGFNSDDINNLVAKAMQFNTGGVDIRARAGRDFEI